MTLPDSYLEYTKRGYGQDIDRYNWRLSRDRQPVTLEGGQDLCVMMVIPAEFHPLNPSGKPFAHPQGMKTPYPDLRHFTTRDYGNRVGIFRLLQALKTYRLKATFPVSAALLDRAPPLIDAIRDGGHEIAAAGLQSDCIHWGGIEAATERHYVSETRRLFEKAGLSPTTWMSPARQQSRQTLDLLSEFGFDNCLDWETDQVPLAAKASGNPVTLLPVHNELEDNKLIIDRRQTEEAWKDQLLEACSFLKSENERFGAQVMGFQVTPFVMGQPFRVFAFDQLCEALSSDEKAVAMTASETAKAFSLARQGQAE